MEQHKKELSNDPNNGLGKRVIGIIAFPAKAVRDIAARPILWFPILLVALSELTLFLTRLPLFMEFLKDQVEIHQAGDIALAGEALEQAIMLRLVIVLISAPLVRIIGWIVITALFFLLVQIFKGEGTFKQYLAVTGYAYIIISLYYLLSIVVSFSTGQIFLDASLANFSRMVEPDLYGTYLYGVLRRADLFTAWNFAVMGIGVAVVGKIKAGKAFLITAVLFVVTVLYGGSGGNYMYM